MGSGAILITPGSEEAKEKAKWEQHHTVYTIGGLQPGNPYVYRAFPKMVYRAQRTPGTGKWAVAQEPPTNFGYHDMQEWDRACQSAAQFTKSCQFTVNNEQELKKARAEGWHESAEEALAFHNLDKIASDAALHRNYEDRNMSEKAKAESAAVEAETFGHVAEIPAQPIKRRGRKPGSKNKPKDGTAA